MSDYGPASDEIMPIQIRPGHIVHIHGMPLDMTKEEADKIVRVVLALANPVMKRRSGGGTK